jgi:hypothetical protein
MIASATQSLPIPSESPALPAGLVNRLFLLTLALLVFAGSLGLAAVWMRQEIFQTAARNRALEVRLADLERQLAGVDAEVAAALNPAVLARQNDAMRLGLAVPREEKVARVTGSPALRLAAKRNRDAFAVTPAVASGAQPVRFQLASTR